MDLKVGDKLYHRDKQGVVITKVGMKYYHFGRDSLIVKSTLKLKNASRPTQFYTTLEEFEKVCYIGNRYKIARRIELEKNYDKLRAIEAILEGE